LLTAKIRAYFDISVAGTTTRHASLLTKKSPIITNISFDADRFATLFFRYRHITSCLAAFGNMVKIVFYFYNCFLLL
jgi:hypothetical protein